MRIKTVANCTEIGIPIGPPSFLNETNFWFKVNFDVNDPSVLPVVIKDTSHPNIRVNSSSGALTLYNQYSTAGQRDILIQGGFGNNGSSNEQFCFAQTSKHDSNGDAKPFSGRAPNSTPANIKEIVISSNREFFLHGQGDFKDFSNLDRLSGWNKYNVIKSADPAAEIRKAATGTAFVDRTFQGCTSLTNNVNVAGIANSKDILKSAQYTFADSAGLKISWYLTGVTNANYMFLNCTSNFDFPMQVLFKRNVILPVVTSAKGMFEGCTNFTGASATQISAWRMKSCTNASGMFKNTGIVDGTSIEYLFGDGTNSTMLDVSSLFEGCTSFTGEKFNKTRFSDLTTAANMFKGCTSFNPAAINKLLSVASATLTDISGILEDCSSLTDGLIWTWKFPNVTNAENAMKGCSSFNGSIFEWFRQNTTVENTSGMFEGCSSWTGSSSQGGSNQTNFRLLACTNADRMFKGCTALNTTKLGNLFRLNTPVVTSAQSMFEGCTSLDINASQWKLTSLLNATNMFKGCTSLVANSCPFWFIQVNASPDSVPDLQTADGMFEGCSSLTLGSGTNTGMNRWALPKLSSAIGMFKNCSSIGSFANLRNLLGEATINGGSLIPELANAESMFEGCTSFNTSDALWVLSNLSNAKNMFKGCAAFNPPNVQTWLQNARGHSLTSAESMFENCTAFNPAQIGHWQFPNCTTAKAMFKGCTSFNKVVWNFFHAGQSNSIQSTESMFEGCTSFVEGQFGQWNLDKTAVFNNANAMMKNASAFGESCTVLEDMLPLAAVRVDWLLGTPKDGTCSAAPVSPPTGDNYEVITADNIDYERSGFYNYRKRIAGFSNTDAETIDPMCNSDENDYLEFDDSTLSYNFKVNGWSGERYRTTTPDSQVYRFNQRPYVYRPSAGIGFYYQFVLVFNNKIDIPAGSKFIAYAQSGYTNVRVRNSHSFGKTGNYGGNTAYPMTCRIHTGDSIGQSPVGALGWNGCNCCPITYFRWAATQGGGNTTVSNDLKDVKAISFQTHGGCRATPAVRVRLLALSARPPALRGPEVKIDGSITLKFKATKFLDIPLTVGSLTGSATIDWGDSSTSTLTTGSSVVSKTYSNSADRTVTITGDVIGFGSTVTNNGYRYVESDGAVFASPPATFKENLTEFTIDKMPTLKDLSYAFHECTNLTTANISTSLIDYVTDLTSMFHDCRSLTSVTFPSTFNTKRVKTMANMFRGCVNLTSCDISNLDTTRCTSYENMFYDCTKLTDITFGTNWSFKRVASLDYMFFNCRSLTSVTFADIDNHTTSSVTNYLNMFYNCSSLSTLSFSATKFLNSGVRNARNMDGMFFGCSSLSSCDISHMATNYVTSRPLRWDNAAFVSTASNLPTAWQ